MPEKVGFIGLGIMGSLQAMNLAKAGLELTVFNRTREKAEAWVSEHGGTVVDSPKAVAEASDVVITMGCGDACPVYHGRRYLDWDLEDPVGKPIERVRTIRDDIESRVRALLTELVPPS